MKYLRLFVVSLVVSFVVFGCLKKPDSAQSLSGKALLEKDLVFQKAIDVVAAGCVANGLTDPKIGPVMSLYAAQLCGQPIQMTIGRIDQGRGECLLDDGKCLFTAGCLRAGEAMQQPTGTPEEQTVLVEKCDKLYETYKASNSK